MIKILIIEKDPTLNRSIGEFVKSLGYEAVGVYDGEEAVDTIDSNESFDLYLLDLDIPKISGLELVRYIRGINTASPIIIMSESIELAKFKKAFALGSSEYIKKPFYLEELEIRIKNVMKAQYDKQIVIDKRIRYDFTHKELFIDNKRVQLRKKERFLLDILLRNVNHTVTSEEIYEYVWEEEEKENYPLRQLVNDLRKKFNTGKKFIFSDVGIGYRFEIKE